MTPVLSRSKSSIFGALCLGTKSVDGCKMARRQRLRPKQASNRVSAAVEAQHHFLLAYGLHNIKASTKQAG